MPNPLEIAVGKRQHLLTDQTSALRLVDGAGDGLPGIILESFANRWLVSTTGSHIPHQIRSWLEDQKKPTYWKQLNQHQKEPPTHLCGPAVNEPFIATENGVRFEISFQSGYSQGIFLDQRDNRAEVIKRMQPGQALLNTFAYTGVFSSAAAKKGAITTTLTSTGPSATYSTTTSTPPSITSAKATPFIGWGASPNRVAISMASFSIPQPSRATTKARCFALKKTTTS